MLCQLLYSSVATSALDADQMRDLVEHARLHNALRSITGALIHFPSSRDIFQVLEGRRPDIERLMRKIHAHRRHGRIEVLYMSAIDARSFAAWPMGFINAESADRAAPHATSGALRNGIASLRLIRAKATELRALRADRDKVAAQALQPTLH